MNYKTREVSLWLGIGILMMPQIFVWFLLRKDHSELSRAIGFGWFALWLILVVIRSTVV